MEPKRLRLRRVHFFPWRGSAIISVACPRPLSFGGDIHGSTGLFPRFRGSHGYHGSSSEQTLRALKSAGPPPSWFPNIGSISVPWGPYLTQSRTSAHYCFSHLLLATITHCAVTRATHLRHCSLGHSSDSVTLLTQIPRALTHYCSSLTKGALKTRSLSELVHYHSLSFHFSHISATGAAT
jgi:hypothetical protein